MKTKLNIVVATALALPITGYAETEQLTTIVVEGSGSRPGTFALAPDSSGFKGTPSSVMRTQTSCPTSNPCSVLQFANIEALLSK